MAALFFDIDGTLVSFKTGKVPESAKKALKLAKKNGHLLFVNTGRTICDISEDVRNLSFDGYLCGCGTYTVYRGKVLEKHSIKYKRGKEIIDRMKACDIEGFFEGNESLYFFEKPYRCEILEKSKKEWKNKHGDGGISINEEIIRYNKFFVYIDEQSEKVPFFSFIEKDIEIIDHKNGFFECIQKNYSKATALYNVCDQLNLDMKDIYAFGDSGNDLPVFQSVKHTVAMGRHNEVLNPYTEYITAEVEKNGIFQALRHYQLI